jgi:HD superfamily phosphohydrolase YqeK
MDIAGLYDWFHRYSQSFYSSDLDVLKGIRHKEDHSIRVAENSLALAKHLRLSERETRVAEAIGLLHDVARHTQWTQFKSFNDVTTKYDHGSEGSAIIASTGILNSSFNRLEQDIILFSIYHHNKISVPVAEPEKVLMANIIRDADKLDIFRILPPVSGDHDYSPILIHTAASMRYDP